MTNRERLLAKDLQCFTAKWQGVQRAKGSQKDYLTVYNGYIQGDYAQVHKTRLYNIHSGEYCTLLEVLNKLYKDHRTQGAN